MKSIKLGYEVLAAKGENNRGDIIWFLALIYDRTWCDRLWMVEVGWDGVSLCGWETTKA